MSHRDFENIEELFRTGLEDMEVPVNDAMWSSISKGINQSGAGVGGSTGAAAAKGGSSLLTYLGLAGVACVVSVAGTLLYTNLKGDKLVTDSIQVVETTVKQPAAESNDVTHLTEVTENTIIAAIPASQEDRKMVDDITKPSATPDPVNKNESDDKPKKTVVVVEESTHDYGNSWVEYFMTPPNESYTTPNSDQNKETENENMVKPTIEEVEEDDIIASIVAAPVGGYAPLEVSFAQYSEKGKVSWDFGDGTSTEEESPTHTFDKYGKYTVTLTITDDSGNQYQDFRVIEVLANSALTKIPNVFTPNFDGVNDVYKVEGKNIASFNLAILNSKGEILHQSSSMDEGWDGRDKFGDELPTGTYVVVISAKGIDGKKYEHSGTVTLNR
ncbi:T9SS type B sorting domain-containing protein [Parvicella tangerina]|uniref:PKD domain-containing protein n=1 Tax=Parvicella tangerina TaxID=2829795 RepID=A0A916JQ09_9FLAO|nr:gliding motility-associated C-terminal domain-containing protein [Parvicella tangerina]CAG5086886.1 hypothetical protein CRYO30217_03319 [Parvicella tangerina]